MSSADQATAMKALKDLQAQGMTPETQAKVYTSMAAKLDTSSDDIAGEVKKLAQQAIATDRTFESIRRQLAVVDQNNYKDKTGQPIAKLQPTWVKYQKRYTNLLWQSRSAATKTEAYLRDLVDVVLPIVLDGESEYEDNLRDLTEFADRANPVRTKDQSDDFTKLQADVEAFSEKFSKFAEDEGEKLNDQITSLTDDIVSLKKDLDDLNNLITEMGIALGATAAAATIGVIVAVSVTAFAAFAPEIVIAVLVAGIAAAIGELSALIAALVKRTKVENEIEDKQRELDEANKQLQMLGELKSKLQLCIDQSSDMFGRLGSFADIWTNCSQDARSLCKSTLKDVHTDKTLQAKIKLMSSTYSAMATAMRYYATLIDESELSPESPVETQGPK